MNLASLQNGHVYQGHICKTFFGCGPDFRDRLDHLQAFDNLTKDGIARLLVAAVIQEGIGLIVDEKLAGG